MADTGESGYSSFLGTGWAFPPAFSAIRKGIETVSDEESIRTSLTILLSTAVGERLMEPKYGCNLQEMLFEPLTTTMKTTEVKLVVDLRLGKGSAKVLTCDLTEEYIKINAEYRT